MREFFVLLVNKLEKLGVNKMRSARVSAQVIASTNNKVRIDGRKHGCLSTLVQIYGILRLSNWRNGTKAFTSQRCDPGSIPDFLPHDEFTKAITVQTSIIN